MTTSLNIDRPSRSVGKSASAKAGTISRLMRAARQEFGKKGLAGARVDVIARNAGVTKQLVYHYYRSKEALFYEVLEDASYSVLLDLVAHDFSHLPAPDALRRFLFEMFEQYRSDPLLGPLALEGLCFRGQCDVKGHRFVELTPSLRDCMQRILVRGIRAGVFRADVDSTQILALSSLVITGGFTNTHTLSVILGWDTADRLHGADRWHLIASDFILAAISTR